MGLLSASSTSSITPTVRSDLQIENSLHVLEKDRTTAVAPSRAFDALHSSKEPRVASTDDGRKHKGFAKNLLCSKLSKCSMCSLNNVQQLHGHRSVLGSMGLDLDSSSDVAAMQQNINCVSKTQTSHLTATVCNNFTGGRSRIAISLRILTA